MILRHMLLLLLMATWLFFHAFASHTPQTIALLQGIDNDDNIAIQTALLTGADINAIDVTNNQNTLLQRAIMLNKPHTIITTLLVGGANPNQQNAHGETALHCCLFEIAGGLIGWNPTTRMFNSDALIALIEHRGLNLVNPFIQNNHGKIALEKFETFPEPEYREALSLFQTFCALATKRHNIFFAKLLLNTHNKYRTDTHIVMQD